MRAKSTFVRTALLAGGLIVTVLVPTSAAAATSATSATTTTTSGTQTAFACATPCDWYSGSVSTRITALKLAEQRAVYLMQIGYTIMTTEAQAQADASSWRGHVRYHG
ncbi:hypothetical protein GCM10010156_32140 [Planobispora rosea]|uniref:Uncharacterized protein n=1 Tax=Planobispora rosea TaxID=35762 RepID=A0A8J3WE02_PLARO|nr:hypothetical protein [Planobispora rosea]GGS70882.1 hypothetical protein GCM10010156_32140 [Planobispora rosea]GIH85397.1 hypothetical protein Pro02_38050 [Planobispora rosea]